MLRILLAGMVVLGFGVACDQAASTVPANPTAIPTISVETATAEPTVGDVPTEAPATQQPTSTPEPTPEPTADEPEQLPAATTEPTPEPAAAAPEPEAQPTPAPTAPSAAVGYSVGNLAPEFTLPSATGSDVSIESYRGEKNLVVVFYRAFW